jgi:hypothetical protein
MCSFRLPNYCLSTNRRGTNCSTEPAYELEGMDGGKSYAHLGKNLFLGKCEAYEFDIASI